MSVKSMKLLLLTGKYDLVNSGQLVFQRSHVCDMAVQESELKYYIHIISFVSLYLSR
jgi:hypothetical protein